MSSIKHAFDGFVFSTIFYEGRPIPLRSCESIEQHRMSAKTAEDIDIEKLEVHGNCFDLQPIRKMLLDYGKTEDEGDDTFKWGYIFKPEICTAQLVTSDSSDGCKNIYVFPLRARKIKVRQPQNNE